MKKNRKFSGKMQWKFSGQIFRLTSLSTHGDFAVIRTNLKFGNRAFRVTGPREWNSLPLSVRQCTSVAQFKSKLKIHLFSVYYDKECSIMHSRARLVFVKAQQKCSIVLYIHTHCSVTMQEGISQCIIHMYIIRYVYSYTFYLCIMSAMLVD